MDLFRIERYMGEDENEIDRQDETLNLKRLQRNIEDRKRKHKQNGDTHVGTGCKRFASDVQEEEKGESREDEATILEESKKKLKKQKRQLKETVKKSKVDEAKDDDLHSDSLKKSLVVENVTENRRSNKRDKRSEEKPKGQSSEKASTDMDCESEQEETGVSVDFDSEKSVVNELRPSKKKKKEKKIKKGGHKRERESTDDRDMGLPVDSEVDEVKEKKKEKNKQNELQSNKAVQSEKKDMYDESQNTSKEIQEEGTKETGFTVIGGRKKHKEVKKVQRVLPDWLAKPVIINSDFKSSVLPVEQLTCLDQHIINKLQKHDINHLFPVQSVVIPAILSQSDNGSCLGKGGFQPSDICVSAPTGSGKTLAYAIPIIQTLLTRVVCHLRALIILPTKDLANQVKHVFDMFTEGTNLKVGLASGSNSFSKDQQQLVSESSCGSSSRVDILVCTTGRLVDHIACTPHFTLQHVRFLVIDEADRLLDQSYHGWLRKVLKAAYNKELTTTGVSNGPMCCNPQTARNPPGQQTSSSFSTIQLPLQKLLFSATMTHSPEKLAPLQLYQPILFTVTATVNQPDNVGLSSADDFKSVARYTIPEGLSEYMTTCNNGEKPLIVLYFLTQLKFQGVLCFASSLEATHRLYLLLKLYGGIEVAEYSSSLTLQQRKRILRDFKQSKLQLLVCSDAMARGMDIQTAAYVISYDVPKFVRNYIHRVGRTARAGNQGTAITLLHREEVYHFKEMIQKTGRKKIPNFNIKQDKLKSMVGKYQEALTQLQDAVKIENQKEPTQKGKRQVVKLLQEQLMKNMLQGNSDE